MAVPPDEISALREQQERDRFAFMNADIDLCETLVAVAAQARASANTERAGQSLAKAETGYRSLVSMLEKPEHWLTDAHRASVKARLDSLGKQIEHERLLGRLG